MTTDVKEDSRKMSNIKKISVTKLQDKEKELEKLIELYLKKSEELEAKEAEVLEKVEMMQSAVASIRAWNERTSSTSSKPVFVDVKEVEEETRRIREETERIQEEVRQKIEDNRRLQEEIDRRKIQEGRDIDDLVREDYVRWDNRNAFEEAMKRREIETRSSGPSPSAPPPDIEDDPGIEFFRDKLKKLKKMESMQKRESKEEMERAALRMKKLKEKIEKLEWESEFDRQLLEALKKKQGKK